MEYSIDCLSLLTTQRYLLSLKQKTIRDKSKKIKKLYQWSELWQATFNIDKCKAMHIGRSNPNTRYYMNKQELAVIKQRKIWALQYPMI